MNTVRTFLKNADVKKIGVVSFYAYFAINILMKAFSYDHGDNIYKWFFYTAILFWGIKMVFTTYTMWEVFWIAVMMGIGVMLSVITRQNMWLLSIMTVVAMKNCRFSVIAQIAVWIRCVAAVILSGGSLIGIFDIGEKTKLDSGYVEQHVYGFAMGEPNTAFLTVFLALLLVLYYNYEKLNVLWCGVTSLIALIFYKMTFCRTGVLVFFFCWVLILFDKVVKSKNIKYYIVQYDLEGYYVDKYVDINSAAGAVGISATSISKVLRGQRNSAAGFVWRKVAADDKIAKRIVIGFDIKKINSGKSKELQN